jgi:hypothetical protein
VKVGGEECSLKTPTFEGTVGSLPQHRRPTLATFSSVNTAITSATGNPGYTATTSLLPIASGTLNGCKTYRNYDNSTNGVNGCSAIASDYDVTISQLLSWNPSLPSNQTICYFLSGFRYCVLFDKL